MEWPVFLHEFFHDPGILDLNAAVSTMISRDLMGKFSCKTCGKTFDAKQGAKRHVEVHLAVQHNCIVCGKTFKTRSALATHYSRHHPTEVSSPWTM